MHLLQPQFLSFPVLFGHNVPPTLLYSHHQYGLSINIKKQQIYKGLQQQHAGDTEEWKKHWPSQVKAWKHVWLNKSICWSNIIQHNSYSQTPRPWQIQYKKSFILMNIVAIATYIWKKLGYFTIQVITKINCESHSLVLTDVSQI